MSKSSPATIVLGGEHAEIEPTPTERLRIKADALCRAALEACHQQQRLALLSRQPALQAEHTLARELCKLCDRALQERVAAYEQASARLHPDGDDEAWWHRANGLWHASREYLRHHSGCDNLSRHLPEHHNAEDLGELQIEYELEASALLALRQAMEAYRRVRPEAA
jgi:hypothetical protein